MGAYQTAGAGRAREPLTNMLLVCPLSARLWKKATRRSMARPRLHQHHREYSKKQRE